MFGKKSKICYYSPILISKAIMKTKKSLTKRIKITKTGKLLTRKPGQNHFNAKRSGRKTNAMSKLQNFEISNKNAARFLPNSK